LVSINCIFQLTSHTFCHTEQHANRPLELHSRHQVFALLDISMMNPCSKSVIYRTIHTQFARLLFWLCSVLPTHSKHQLSCNIDTVLSTSQHIGTEAFSAYV